MKIPKHIDKLLLRRAKAAETFVATDAQIQAWLDKNNIKVSQDYITSGVCAVYEPYSSILEIRKCIEETEDK